MKQKLPLVLVTAIALSLFSGCTQVDNAHEEATAAEQIQSEDVAQTANPLDTLELPERFTGDWTGLKDNSFIVHADAEIHVPELTSIPTATVRRKDFPQEDADHLLEVFLKGNTLYKDVFTKQMAMAEIDRLEAIQRGENPLNSDFLTMEAIPERIAYYEELLKTAPDESELFPADTTFHEPEFPSGAKVSSDFSREEIRGYATVGQKKVNVSIHRGDGREQAVIYIDGYGDANSPYSVEREAQDATMTVEKAMELGDSLMEELGFSNVICVKATPVSFYHAPMTCNKDGEVEYFDHGYELEYARTLAGQSIYTPGYVGTSTPENEPDPGIWGYEIIHVTVNTDDIVYFNWRYPCTEPEILKENNTLLPFSDITDIFEKMFFVKNSYWEAANQKNGFAVIHDINIDKVELNFMRIRDKYNLNEGTIVPVWDFWATTSAHAGDDAHKDLVYDGEYYEIVLTINALDGTMIDRELGY